MASDIAEFLKKNLLNSIEAVIELKLSPSITSLSNEIKEEFIEYKGYWSPPPNESLSCLYQLDHALTELQSNHKKTLSLFSRLDHEKDPKTMLKGIKDTLVKIRERSQKNGNSTSTSSMSPTINTSSMSPTINNSSYSSAFNEEIEKILYWLESNDLGLKAIGIHGMCGTGKTTLVEMVLEKQCVRDKYAQPIWVSLSDLTSKDEMDIRIVKEMLARLNDDPDLLTEEPKDDWLVDKLYDKLKAQKKYLIVLDGVWHCNDWFSNLYVDEKGEMTKPLFSQALPQDTGGAVIVTSRIKKVTEELVGERNLIHLKPWSVEKMKEFVRLCLENNGKRSETIPQEKIDFVAYHCHGLPLVAACLSDWIAHHI